MKTSNCVLTLLLLIGYNTAFTQVGIGTTNPNNSAKLEVSSTTQGFLPPRMNTTQRDAINNPATGLIIFNTTTNGLEIKTNSGWLSLTQSSSVTLPTVIIGAQKWMEKNLNVAFFQDGSEIPYVENGTTWQSLTTPAWCYYNNDPANQEIYGKLYNWYAVADPRGLCPAGWHIPTDAEWTTLANTLGGASVAGGKLKATGVSYWTTPNTGAKNESGFTALPGGERGYFGNYYQIGTNSWWWSSTENNSNDRVSIRYLNHNTSTIESNESSKWPGYSVRCIKN